MFASGEKILIGLGGINGIIYLFKELPNHDVMFADTLLNKVWMLDLTVVI